MIDKDVAALIKAEETRQREGLELIPSENYVSRDVLTAMGSIFTNKYSEGYPGKYPVGREIRGLEAVDENAVVFHAGTKQANGQIVTDGGRVLGVTGWGNTLPAALAEAYTAVERIEFQGMHYRRDIGWRAINGPLREADTLRGTQADNGR